MPLPAIDRLNLAPCKRLYVSRLQPRQRDRADCPPDESQRGIADCRRHAPHLSVLAFGDRKLNPRCRDAGTKANRHRTFGAWAWDDGRIVVADHRRSHAGVAGRAQVVNINARGLVTLCPYQRLIASISRCVSASRSPGCNPASVIAPIAQRTSRSVG